MVQCLVKYREMCTLYRSTADRCSATGCITMWVTNYITTKK